MEEYIKPIIPLSVLSDNRISSLEKLLLIHIISLCNNKGYCWATNSYFMKVHGYSKQTISKCINYLASLNYIHLKYEKESIIAGVCVRYQWRYDAGSTFGYGG